MSIAPPAAQASSQHYNLHFIDPDSSKRSVWGTDGQRKPETDTTFTGYTFRGNPVGQDGSQVFCSVTTYADPTLNQYAIALDRDRRIFDPGDADMHRHSTTPCSKEQFEQYLHFLRTDQRNFLMKLRGELPRNY